MYWEPYGSPSGMKNTLDIDEDRRLVFGECGGYCGGCRAHGGKLTVEVEYCQKGVKCKSNVANDSVYLFFKITVTKYERLLMSLQLVIKA